MDEKALFAKFWTKESKTTRNVIKSRTAKQIAWQIYWEENFIMEGLENGKAEWAPGGVPETMTELLDAYDKQSATMGERLAALPPERWEGAIDFGGHARPASAMAWSFLFDLVHHRGQISTYLRPMGAKVPQIYGPSGDEP